jgi:hypothetical protein
MACPPTLLSRDMELHTFVNFSWLIFGASTIGWDVWNSESWISETATTVQSVTDGIDGNGTDVLYDFFARNSISLNMNYRTLVNYQRILYKHGLSAFDSSSVGTSSFFSCSSMNLLDWKFVGLGLR